MFDLNQEIRALYGNQGPLERDDIVPILLALLDRIEKLEDAEREAT